MKKVIQTSYHKGHYTCKPKEIEDTPMYCEQECGCEDPCDDGCPVQLDADCVFYHKDTDQASQLKCLKLKNGTSLTRILEVIDSKLCGCGGLPHINDINLSCLESKYGKIKTLVEFFEKVDKEICKIYDAIKTVSDANSSALSNILNILNDIRYPGINAPCATIAITDDIKTVLAKIVTQLCALGQPITINTNQSNTISWSASSGPNYNLIAKVRVSSDPGNIIQERTNGIYATAPVFTSTDEKVKTSPTDTTAGYLNTKIIGCQENNYIKTNVVQTISNQMQVCTQLDVINLLTYIRDNAGAKALFCEIVSSCTVPTPVVPTPVTPTPVTPTPTGCVCHAGIITNNNAFSYFDCQGIQFAGGAESGTEICYDTSFTSTNITDLGVSAVCNCGSVPTPVAPTPVAPPTPIASGTVVPPQDPLVIGFSPDNKVYHYNPTTNLMVPLFDYGTASSDIAHTETKLWVIVSDAFADTILEYNITLNPWTQVYNRTITVPSGFRIGPGFSAVNNTQLIAINDAPSPDLGVLLDITNNAATSTTLFTFPNGRTLGGDIHRTTSGKYIAITYQANAGPDFYLTQWSSAGTIEVDSYMPVDYLNDPATTLFEYNGTLFVGTKPGNIYSVNPVSPNPLTYVQNVGTSLSGGSTIASYLNINLTP